MAVVSYQRILDGAGLSGKFGESLQATERWQVRVDLPTTTRLDILQTLATGGIVWGASHPEFSALKAMEFTLDAEGREGMRWLFTVKYYVPPATKTPQASGIPKDAWERSGGTSTVPVFRDTSNVSITNAAGDPLEGLERLGKLAGKARTVEDPLVGDDSHYQPSATTKSSSAVLAAISWSASSCCS